MSKLHVSQLDRGMDLGPAHKNIAINHLVARSMGRVMAEDDIDPERPSFSPGGPEDDSPTTWHRARKEARAMTPAPDSPEPIVEEPVARRRRLNPLWVPGTDGITYSTASSPERLEEIHAAWEERLKVFNARTTYIRDEISGFTR